MIASKRASPLWRPIRSVALWRIPTSSAVLTVATTAEPVHPHGRDSNGLSLVAAAVLALHSRQPLPDGLCAAWGVATDLHRSDVVDAGKPPQMHGGLLVFAPVQGPGVMLVAVLSRLDATSPPMDWQALFGPPTTHKAIRLTQDAVRGARGPGRPPLEALAAVRDSAYSSGLPSGSALTQARL